MSKQTPNTRRMRRSREAAATSDSSLSGFDLYNVKGNSKAALKVFQELLETESPKNVANEYNTLLLSQMMASRNDHTADTFLQSLEAFEKSHDQQQHQQNPPPKTATTESNVSGKEKATSNSIGATGISARKRHRNELVFCYNRALIMHAKGDVTQCARLLGDKLKSIMGNSDSTSHTSNKSKGSSSSTPKAPVEDIAFCVSRMSLLLLECVLTLTVVVPTMEVSTASKDTKSDGNSNANLTTISAAQQTCQQLKIPTPPEIIQWLEGFNTEKDPQLKFLLNLYKSRLELAALDRRGKHEESSLRASRKELKQAMEVFQHVLRPAFLGNHATGSGETASTVSSINSEDNSTVQQQKLQQNQQQQERQQQFSMQTASTSTATPAQKSNSIVLQKLNQSALNLKAHLEQLKGNTKKSLILCGEALGSTQEGGLSVIGDKENLTNITYQTIHSNNLAVIYETNGKKHLALHALSKSLQSITNSNPGVATRGGTTTSDLFCTDDGVELPSTMLPVLYNTAICALKARHFLSAYECMATFLSLVSSCSALGGSVTLQRPRCWIHMAEACIGVYHQQHGDGPNQHGGSRISPTDRMTSGVEMFSTFDADGDAVSMILNDSMLNQSDLQRSHDAEELVKEIGSLEDLEQVGRNPLLRARAALWLVLEDSSSRSNQNDGGEQESPPASNSSAMSSLLSPVELVSARLMLAFVYLSFRQFQEALEVCRSVLSEFHEDGLMKTTYYQSSRSKDEGKESKELEPLLVILMKRLAATARMYAAEANCALGNTAEAVHTMIRNGGSTNMHATTTNTNNLDSSFHSLASDLCGVTMEQAAINSQGKKRLARAQTVVRSSYCGLAASMGNIAAAKKVAMSAQGMEDACSQSRERSVARRALIYALLRDGQQSAALSLLFSLR